MDVLIALGCPYFPSTGGAVKVTRTIAEELVRRGHRVRVLALGRARVERGASLRDFLDRLDAAGIRATATEQGVDFDLNGVEVRAIDGAFRIAGELSAEIRKMDPDWIFLQTEDFRCMLLNAALEIAPERTVYFAHSTVQLPLGPDSADPRAEGARIFQRLRHVIAPSRWVASYVREHTGIEAHVVYAIAEVFGRPPFPSYGRHDAGSVMMINACGLKGLPIFLELAEARPNLPFSAVKSWGTTPADLAALERLPNVRALDPSPDVDSFYSQARVLLVPSLWTETFGLIVIEAMLRGIPVLAADNGGLPEAALGVSPTLPVRKISRYTTHAGVPVAADEIAEQDVGPWLEALDRVLEPTEYALRSEASREAATRWLSENGIERLERVLESLAVNE